MAERIAGMHAMPRLGQPEDAAELASFLLSDDASWITGQIIGVDGGAFCGALSLLSLIVRVLTRHAPENLPVS